LVTLFSLSCRLLAVDFYLATNGDDGNDGQSIARPVATLKRAIELSRNKVKSEEDAVRIFVQPGTYVGQTIVLESSDTKGRLAIIGQGKKPDEFPIFAGAGNIATWFTLRGSQGRDSGLTIEALKIRDYFTAVSLEGDRDDKRRGNAGTTIRRNVFQNIGSVAVSENASSTAAIRLVNSHSNIIENNYFGRIRNRQDCGSLHAIYVAHFSSGNVISNNTFDDICGSVIKLRDRSNDNIIRNNRFAHLERVSAIEEWFCDMADRQDCTKKLGECPSTGNAADGNSISESVQPTMISINGNHERRPWCLAEDFEKERVVTR